MKYENYLVLIRDTNGKITYKLARGYRLAEDENLAYCKLVEPVFRKNYMIIDRASGLFVITGTSKAKVLESWKEKSLSPEFINRIIDARMTRTYHERISEATKEKKIWRESGYIIEGRGFEL